MRVTFEKSQLEASNITTYWFRPDKAINYTAGQFVELNLKHDEPDQRGTKRWFTLSSAPGEPIVSITTKLSQEGSSFKKALQKLQPGDQLQMSEPMGDFVLPKNPNQPLIFVAGGIGITPFHSMFQWLADHKEHRPISFIYGVGRESEIIFQQSYEKAGIHTIIVVDQPSDSWGGERGKLSAELILGLAKLSNDSLIYLSGPEPMVEKLDTHLKQLDVKPDQLVTDFFPGYTTI